MPVTRRPLMLMPRKTKKPCKQQTEEFQTAASLLCSFSYPPSCLTSHSGPQPTDEAFPRPRALAGNTNSGVERSLRKTLNTAGDQRDNAQADAPNAHGPLANGRTCGYNGGTAQALGSAVLSGGFTLHRGMVGCRPPCPAADCASFLYYTAVFQNMQQGFFGFLGFAPPSGSLRGGNGGGGGFFDYMAPSCRERRPRRSAQQNTGFRITSGESAAAPLPAADAPTNADVGRIRKRVADSPNVVPCRGCCCAERASPFPTGGRMRIRRGLVRVVGVAARRAGSARPTTGQVRIRRGLDHAFGGCCGGCRGRHPLQGGDGCGFAGSMSGSWVLLCGVPGRHAPYGWILAGSPGVCG